MKKKSISKRVLKISDGVFSTLTDLVLWNLFYFAELSPLANSTNLRKAGCNACKDLESFNYETIKRAIYNGRAKKWLKSDFTLTEEGEKRLKKFIPDYFERKKWDGNWYLVSYDIPEKRRGERHVFRENLRRLGFREMHASLWISPFNFFTNIEELIQEYDLSSFVILAVSDKLGREASIDLAERIWGLRQINEGYKELIEMAKNKDPKNLIFIYFAILKNDAQLPEELLPDDWAGEEAYSIFGKYFNFMERKVKIIEGSI